MTRAMIVRRKLENAVQPTEAGMYATGYVRAIRDLARVLRGPDIGITAIELSDLCETHAQRIVSAMRGEGTIA